MKRLYVPKELRIAPKLDDRRSIGQIRPRYALLINPFSLEETVEAMHRAITMPEAERRWRMQRLRRTVAENNIYRWGGKFIDGLLRMETAEFAAAAGAA